MSKTLDSFISRFGEDALGPSGRTTVHNWQVICVCGHQQRFHSQSVGGSYERPESRIEVQQGREVTITMVFRGCVGALRPKNFEDETFSDLNREAGTAIETFNVTCPCTEFRPLARVDRPNRMFSQRRPADMTDAARHPFSLGVKALHTFLGRRKAAQTDPDWADQEFDRRFEWIEEARVCGLSRCTKTEDVWPVYVDEEGTSELRCASH